MNTSRRTSCRVLSSTLLACLCIAAAPTTAPTAVNWPSLATGGDIPGKILVPAAAATQPAKPLAAVLYLKGLSVPRLGREPDDPILADLLNAGHLVVVLDYALHPKAVSPDLNADALKFRGDVAGHKLLADYKVDLDHLFILAEGFRLKRDVEFARDGKRVLAMDIQYPSRPEKPVPALVEFSCDNANRMGTGSLLFCRDTLLDGAQFAGFAVAMADHPVAPPYKGIDDPMPDVVYRLKAAVRTLGAEGKGLGLSGKIGAVGFSRGSNMAALLATTGGAADLEGDRDAPHRDVSSRIQAAMAHGGRFDFTALRPDDSMFKRFEKAWGPLDANRDRWAAHGAVQYLTKDAAPMFLNTSDAESPEYRDGLALLARRLDAAGVEHVYHEDADGRGHRVSTDPKTLTAAYAFFAKHLAGD